MPLVSAAEESGRSVGSRHRVGAQVPQIAGPALHASMPPIRLYLARTTSPDSST